MRFKPVYEVHVAPDGATVAYLVSRYDQKADESIADLWSVGWTGQGDTQLTHGESVSDPAFSPDGRYLSYLTAHPEGSTTQLWVRELRSGATRALTHVQQEIEGYTWSADGKHVALVMHEGIEAPQAKDGKKRPPKPIVVDAFQFKADKDGYFTVLGRSDDVLNVAGHRIGSADVESALVSHPAVAEAAVIGVPDLEKGEIIKAIVVARPGSDLDVKSLETFCQQHLGRQKRPRQIEIVTELPKNFLGKIQRRRLRDSANGTRV